MREKAGEVTKENLSGCGKRVKERRRRVWLEGTVLHLELYVALQGMQAHALRARRGVFAIPAKRSSYPHDQRITTNLLLVSYLVWQAREVKYDERWSVLGPNRTMLAVDHE
jgi:hypothetical protein